jgi:hypothetical protein
MADKTSRKNYDFRQCVICYGQFKPVILTQLTCCASCRTEYQRNVARGKQRKKALERPKPVKRFADCVNCGAVFHKRREDHVVCTIKCRAVLNRAARPSRAVLSHILAKELRSCRCCGDRFKPATYQQSYCSDRCRVRQSYNHLRAKTGSKRDPNTRRTCDECGVDYCPRDKRQSYCSLACSGKAFHRITTRVRRARVAKVEVEKVDPIRVFERDGWKCQLCGIKTPKQLRGSRANNAPELDHIMPISKGGSHSYTNTQCSCHKCNHAKGSKPLGQTLLFG